MTENDKIFDWCWNLITETEDWNTLPLATRKKLIKNLKICVSTLTDAQVSESQLSELVEVTDITTVFDAVLGLWANFSRSNPPTNEQVLRYLRKAVMNSWKAQRKRQTYFHKERKTKERKSVAPSDYVRDHHPLNYKVCKSCGEVLRLGSKSDLCTKCKGNAEIEYKPSGSGSTQANST